MRRILLTFNGQIDVYPTVESRQLVRKVAKNFGIQRQSRSVSEYRKSRTRLLLDCYFLLTPRGGLETLTLQLSLQRPSQAFNSTR